MSDQFHSAGYDGSEEDYWAAYGEIRKIPLRDTYIPPEQRDTINNHKGLAAGIVPGRVGTLVALYDPVEKKYALVDGFQRSEHLRERFGEDFAPFVHVPADEYTPAKGLEYFLSLNAGRAEVKGYYYWRSKLSTADLYPGIKAVTQAIHDAAWNVGPKATPTTGTTFTALTDLCTFTGLSLKDFRPEDSAATVDDRSLAAVTRAMVLISAAWGDDPEYKSKQHGAEVVIGLARVLRDARTVRGKPAAEAQISDMLKNTDPVTVTNRAASQVKDAINPDGSPKYVSSTHGGNNGGKLGARWYLMLLNDDGFDFKNGRVELKVNTRKSAKTRLHLSGDKALADALGIAPEED